MTQEIIEYSEVDLSRDALPPSEPPRPWVWGLVGILLGSFFGFVSVSDFDTIPTANETLPPLTLPVEAAVDGDALPGESTPRALVPGFNQTLWILVDPESPRLLRWSAHEPAPSADVRPISTLTARPDASGAAYAEEVELAGGTALLVTRAPGDFAAEPTSALSFATNGWAWHESIPRRIAWSEFDGEQTTFRWTSFGPTDGELTVPGEWAVVAYDERIIAQSSSSALIIDPDGNAPLVEREVPEGPLIIQGLLDGLAYATFGPERTMVAMELELGNKDRVSWRHPDAISISGAPGSDWGMLWFGRSVEIHGPDDVVFTHVASGEPHWSADGRFLVFPDSGNIIIFDTTFRRFGTLPVGERVIAVWGS